MSSKPFQKIVSLDLNNVRAWAFDILQQYAAEPVKVYPDDPTTSTEIIERIGTADCVLVGWSTPITAEVIEACPNLKYIGMCCGLYDKASANVDIDAAERQGIGVKGVKDYGDEGAVEFVFAQLISLAKGIGKHQWKAEPTEIKGKTIGIIGLGKLGQMVAQLAQAFGMKVLYYSRTRRPELESENLQYLPLNELLQQVDVVTTHLPRNNPILQAEQFALLKPNSVLVNTSLGATYSIEAFKAWVSQPGNYAIVDLDGAEGHEAVYPEYDQVLFYDRVVGMTDAAYDRLSEKVISNLEQFLKENR